MRNILTFLILSLLITPLFGENILGEMAGVLQLESDAGTSGVEITLEDLAGIDYLYDNPFVQGVELEFAIPDETKRFRNSFALYLYRSNTPRPEPDITSYRGNQFFMQILPFSSDFSVKIPFANDNTLVKDAASVVTAPVPLDDFPLLVTLLPIMKGLPTQAKNAGITMSARPLYFDKGGLRIIISDESNLLEKSTEILIDNRPVSWPKDYYTLEPGFHRVEINNELSGNREFNIAVEAGKFTEIHHVLEEASPRIKFISREGVDYYLDGVILSQEQTDTLYSVEPGRHLVEIKLSGGFTVSREYMFSAGEDVTISLEAQILIEKN